MDDAQLTEALEPVLDDLRAQNAVLPQVRVVANYGIMLYASDGSGQGVTPPRGTTAPDRLANLADQVQEWAVEALWGAGAPAVWPHCPTHPNTHPLKATAVADVAVWVCPANGETVAPIGELGSYGVTGIG